MKIRCAICDRPCASGAANPWRPFCSERCKMIDLSRWLGGDYVIPGGGASAASGEPALGEAREPPSPEDPAP